MKDCLFCKIIGGEIPSQKLYEDERMIIIRDIDPKAANHFLLIPKKHYQTVLEMTAEEGAELTCCLLKIKELVGVLGLSGGFRMVINQGANAGQTVPHLHVHILSGQKMEWNPA